MTTTKVETPIKELKYTFDIFIPQTVETKIRLYCKHIDTVEWSGVLFYKVEGTFIDKNIKIICVDICPMDIGTSGYTEYKVSPEVSTYMVDNPELLESGIYQGLIHSHNNMAAFFSGTDVSTLIAEGLDMPHFVSLIVNNKGEYVAAMTRQSVIRQIVHQTRNFSTWEGGNTQLQEVYDMEQTQLERINLDILHEYEKEEDKIVELLNDIKKRKEEEKKATPIINTTSNISPYWNRVIPKTPDSNVRATTPFNNTTGLSKVANNQGVLFPKQTQIEPQFSVQLEEEDDPLFNYLDTVKIDPDFIKELMQKLLYCTAILPIKPKSVEQLMSTSEARFGSTFGSVKNFSYFASNYIEYLLNDIPASLLAQADNNVTIASSLLAYHLSAELEEYKDNKWIGVYIDQINNYL